MQVSTTVRKDIVSKIIIENRTNLVSHPYCMVIDIKKLHPQSGKSLQKTRIVNLYDNKIGRGQLWEGPTSLVRHVIQHIP